MLVTVRFPWGSLLRGCVGQDAVVAAGIAGLVRPGGTLELMLASSARDGLDGIPSEGDDLVRSVERAFGPHGLVRTGGRLATPEEVAASRSSWARRLRSQRPGDRAVMLIKMIRPLGNDPDVGGSGHGFVPAE